MNRTSNRLFFATLAALALLATALQAQHPRRGPGPGGPPPFAKADTNGDGSVTSAEWSALFATLDADHNGTLEGSELPGPPPHGPEALAYLLSHDADTNGDNKVGLAEYKARIAKLDADGDGSLSFSELPLHPRRGGPAPDGPPPFVGDADTDGNGELSVAELVAVFNSADEERDGILLLHGPRERR